MKRFGTICILFLLLHTQIGYIGQFLFLRWQVRQQAHMTWIASLPDEKLIAIPLQEVNASGTWEEKGKEFSLRDRMYDVIRQKDIAGRTWLYCLDDDRETELVRQSDHLITLGQDQPLKKDCRFTFFKIDDTLLPPSAGLNTPAGQENRNNALTVANQKIKDCFSEIPVPPPRS